MTDQSLEQVLIERLKPQTEYITKADVTKMFSEGGEFSESGSGLVSKFTGAGGFFGISGGNLLIIGLGLILANTLVGFLGRFVPFGNFTGIVIGIVLRAIFRKGIAGDFASGVFLAGIVQLINMLLSGVGLKFSEGDSADDVDTMFSEGGGVMW